MSEMTSTRQKRKFSGVSLIVIRWPKMIGPEERTPRKVDALEARAPAVKGPVRDTVILLTRTPWVFVVLILAVG
jgi:hypothetical protein